MPSSRSAKEICREFGNKDIACKVAKSREARRRRRKEAEGTAPSPPPPPPPPPPAEDLTIGERRRRRIDEAIRQAEEGT